ncbi:GTP binding protein [Aureococcus anophagefferens]|nr:GTP binding protein [Aureococcus anophagefferens]
MIVRSRAVCSSVREVGLVEEDGVRRFDLFHEQVDDGAHGRPVEAVEQRREGRPDTAARSGDAYYRYEDDWGHSFPGRLARCAVPIFEASCLDMRSKLMSHECNFLLARTFRVLTTLPRSWSVYREDYKPYPGGGPVCAVLRTTSRPAVPGLRGRGRRVACRRYAHAAGLARQVPTSVNFFAVGRPGAPRRGGPRGAASDARRAAAAKLFVVDLPGFGYARRGGERREAFGAAALAYLSSRPGAVLRQVCVLVDARRGPDPAVLESFSELRVPRCVELDRRSGGVFGTL